VTATPGSVQRVYLTLTLLTTFAASFIWGVNTLFLLDAGLSNAEAFAANAFFSAGQVIFEADSLRTGADGRLGLTLKDDTRVSLGPGSEVRLDQFVYAPAEGRLGFVLQVVRGAVAYVSGRIAKLAPDSIRLETPAAVVGVRGTTIALQVTPQ